MTYIAAFHCLGGIAMCADTQESVEEYKSYTEKIAIVEDLSYPLAVGGAGFSDLIDCLTAEIIERAAAQKPATKADLKKMLRDAIAHVYETDVPTLVMGRQFRTPELVIAAKTGEGFCIFTTKGKRVLAEAARAIIGYGTVSNFELLKRLHKPSLPMQQAVMLAVYLTSQSIKTDRDVGGEPRVAVVVNNGAWIDDTEYIAVAEQRVKDFLALTDEMFLTCIDVSIAPTAYQAKTVDVMQRIATLREQYLRYSAARSLQRTFGDPTYRGEPYPKIFTGAVTMLMGDGSIQVREDTSEEIARRKELYEAASAGYNRVAGDRFNALLNGRTPIYLGEEIVHVKGTAGPVAESGMEG